MEQRSRSQKYQKLRESMALEAETIVKSNDLSRYAKQMEAFQTPTTQEFQFDKEEVVEGSRSRVHTDMIKEQESQDIQNYKNDLQKDSEWIDQLLQENEKLMQDMKPEKREEPKAAPSRTKKYAAMYVIDDDPIFDIKPKEEVHVSDWFDVKPEEPVQVPVKEEPVQQEVVKPVQVPVKEEPVQQEVVKQDPVVEEMPVVEEDQPEELDFDIDNEEEEAVIKDNFLDDILKEAKQYSVEKGQRAEIDTTATILSELTQAQPLEPQMDPFMVPTGEDDSFDAAFAAEIEELLNEHSEEKQEEEPKEDSIPAQIQAIIDDDPSVSFFVEEEVEEGLPEENLMEDFTPLVEEMNEIEPVIATEEEPMNVKESQHDQDIMELTQKLERERIFREEVMQETKQMKLQLNEYESELNTVNHTVSRTNKVLNFVLIVLIIALFCLLAFIAYWAMVDRGIIPAASNDVMDVWMLTVVSLI